MVSLSLTGAAERSSLEVRNLPLVGVSMDSNEPSDRRVVVMLGNTAEDHLSHSIAAVRKIRLDEDDCTLQIESENGGTTVLKWSAPPRM